MYRFASFIFLVMIIGMACRPTVFPPKPQGYFRIDTPEQRRYRLFEREGFPYTFEYPVYARIEDDTVFQSQKEHNPYWINMYFPVFDGVINITYREISAEFPFMRLVSESDGLSFSHHEKADFIEPFLFNFPDRHVSGILYTVGGNAATRYQFTATDSVKHFFRGALYFNVTPNADSLKPATDFIEKDIEHILGTLRWK